MAKISKKKWLYGCIALFLGSFGAYKSYYLYQNYFYPHRFDRYESNEQATLALNKVFPIGTNGDDVRKTLESDGYKCSQGFIVREEENIRVNAKHGFSCNPEDYSEKLYKTGVLVFLDKENRVVKLVMFGSFLGL